MTRIAIVGGGISGLTAAYELELARRAGAPIDWHLYEASGRLGGIVETSRRETPEGTYILEGGPDGWVSEKPWARKLAIELGLEAELIYSNDATRKTYILQPDPGEAGKANQSSRLLAIPDRMRLMVPEDLATLENSPLFTATARAAYANELSNAAQLKSTSPFADPTHDESVASFLLRHFGEEVLTKLASPLLSGVFGGDVAKLSVRAVMPAFVAMEREHGSLIAGLQEKRASCVTDTPGGPFIAQPHRAMSGEQPIFTTLRRGMGSLVEAIVATLPSERLHLKTPAYRFMLDEDGWTLDFVQRNRWFGFGGVSDTFDDVFLATPLEVTRSMLSDWREWTALIGLSIAGGAHHLLAEDASSAVLASLAWRGNAAKNFTLPPGFGFLVPDQTLSSRSGRVARSGEIPAFRDPRTTTEPQLLACTFVDQKFPHRAPPGARILRAFFGGPTAETLTTQSDETIAAAALAQLHQILGPLPAPEPSLTTVRRWPRSLPQYEVGHLARISELEELVAQRPGLHLLGNSYRGVGLPDLIRSARDAARRVARHAAEAAHG